MLIYYHFFRIRQFDSDGQREKGFSKDSKKRKDLPKLARRLKEDVLWRLRLSISENENRLRDELKNNIDK